MTATEARNDWFRLLDDALRGEIIVVQRKGRRVVLRREELKGTKAGAEIPSYKKLLRAPTADKADRWSWEWRKAESNVIPRRRRTR